MLDQNQKGLVMKTTTTGAAQRQCSGDDRVSADHDLDVVDEPSRRLDGLPRYDVFIDHANGQSAFQSLWRDLQAQELDGIERLKSLLTDKIKAACF
jgi:hypothetical protein